MAKKSFIQTIKDFFKGSRTFLSIRMNLPNSPQKNLPKKLQKKLRKNLLKNPQKLPRNRPTISYLKKCRLKNLRLRKKWLRNPKTMSRLSKFMGLTKTTTICSRASRRARRQIFSDKDADGR